MDQSEIQLRRGVVELAVLATVARGETYGYRIVEQLRPLVGLAFSESTVYPVLARLAGEELLAVRSESSPAGPTRRYYSLTPRGKQRLQSLTERWRAISISLGSLLPEAS